jgi:hypothetical protein
MYIKPCPKCGRMPKITEGHSFKNGTRRRFIGCPNYCSVLEPQNLYHTFAYSCWNTYIGDGDDNAIYSLWNERLIRKE